MDYSEIYHFITPLVEMHYPGRAGELSEPAVSPYLRDCGKDFPEQLKGIVLPVVIQDPGTQALVHLKGEWMLQPFLQESETH